MSNTDADLRAQALGKLWKAAEAAGLTPEQFYDSCLEGPIYKRWKGVVWNRMVQGAVARYRATHEGSEV